MAAVSSARVITFAAPLTPHVTISEGVARALKFWLGQRFQHLLGDSQIASRRDLHVDFRTGNQSHGVPCQLHNLGIIGRFL